MSLLLAFVCSFKAQKSGKTNPKEKASVPSYHDLHLSEKGRWLLSRTVYGQNTDTLLLFDTKYPQKIKAKLVKLNVKQTFIGEDLMLAQGVGIADLIRLKDMHRISYSGVKKADVLHKKGKYVILDEKNVLSVYNTRSEKIKEIKDVEDYVSDGEAVLIAITKKDSLYGLVNVLERDNITVYTGTDELTSIPLFEVGRYAAFTQTNVKDRKIRVILVNTQTSVASMPLKDAYIDADFIRLTQGENGSYFLIESEKRKQPEKNAVDIWYGNDPYIRFRKRGIAKNKYWLFHTENNTLESLSEEKEFDYISINNERFFLTLNKAETFDYRFSGPVFTMYLYDHYTKSSRKIGDAVRNVEVSLRGRYIVMCNELMKDWILFDTKSMKSQNLGTGISNPLFSSDESVLMFESTNGVKVYSLSQHKFLETLLPDLEPVIEHKSSVSTFQKYEMMIHMSGEEVDKGIIFKTRDKNNNAISYYWWNGKHLKTIIPKTEKYFRDFEVSFSPLEYAYTIEESFNKKPDIYQYKVGRKEKLCMSCRKSQGTDLESREEIIAYKNSLGKELKGVLYYPLDYQPEQKYPMVVKIYMEQSISRGMYLTNEDGGDGFNLKLLLEKGYFVFLPDIVMDERGSGLAALDCVHRSLDALDSVKAINHTRIGLIGHSFGGFETNFIATHSNRFKAYISGSGVSHLMGHYFTNNQHFGFNEYSRIENGQYGMKIPFTQDKELYWKNDPIYASEKMSAPILLWAGLQDHNVLASQTMAFYTALVRNKKDVIAIFYSNQGHTLEPESMEIEDLSRREIEWWDYFLKDKKDTKWINRQMKKDAKKRPSL